MSRTVALALARVVVVVVVAVVANDPTAFAQDATTRAEDQELERYQQCFQKMIDSNAQDNAFMRKCLGIEERPVPKKGAKGELEFLAKDEAAKVIERALPDLKGCYDKLLAQTKELGITPEGSVETRLEIKQDGSVGEMAFLPSTLTDVGLLACVKLKLKSLVFPKTTEEAPVNALVALKLAAQNGRKGSVTLVKDSPRLAGAAYEYSEKDAYGVFRKNSAAIRRCYDALVKRDPKAQGQAVLEVALSGKGKVGRVTWRELAVGDDEFKTCLTAEIKTWRYPPPRSGDPTTVKYPAFTFRPR